MSRRHKQPKGASRPEGKARRLLQLVEQRQQRLRRPRPYHQAGDDLEEKQQQTHHNEVSEKLPFGLFTSQQ